MRRSATTGFGAGTIVARNAASGRALAERLGYEYAEDVGDRSASVIVNVQILTHVHCRRRVVSRQHHIQVLV